MANSLLQIKLRFNNEKNPQRPGPRNLKSHAETSSKKIGKLIEDLSAILRFYNGMPKILQGFLIDVNYNDIVAKSNRVRELLKPRKKNVNDAIVGARFSDAADSKENHIITYYVDGKTIEDTIEKLAIAQRFLDDQLSGKATPENFSAKIRGIVYDGYGLTQSRLRDVVIDCSVVDSFSVPKITNSPRNESFLVTFYRTELSLAKLLEKLDVDEAKYPYSFCGQDTISVRKNLFDFLESRVPYLISMISPDFSKVVPEEIGLKRAKEKIHIPVPTNEPIIGVIDTLFCEDVYFKDWVENIDDLSAIEQSIAKNNSREHGTEVSSIIVDGPTLNPWLNDGCGRFRVRHFGICVDSISVTRLVQKIQNIVNKNPDIHVWNLSLGTNDEVSKNFISFDAAALDEIQSQKNVIFVISGTNDTRAERPNLLAVGSPADSLNSVVVNSVRRDGTPASYSRRGNILSFFNKPDISYYGGDFDQRIFAYSPCGITEVYGTSFAAPWISRKLCYLIDIMGLPREIAKALIVDSAAGWEYKQSTYKNKDTLGYGVVPININELLTSDSREIKFVVYGTAESFNTTNYAIPVPRDDNDKYPYIARAVLCYFPKCHRSQGVDYTSRELSLQFGRVKRDGTIDDINDNTQDALGAYVDERQSRREFRKWENTKFISKVLKKNRPINSYDERLWGIKITSKSRLDLDTSEQLNFGVVITLREVNGVNRIQDFITACTLRGWIVTKFDIQQQVELYNTSQEEIDFE